MEHKNLILKPDFLEVKRVREEFRNFAEKYNISHENEYFIELVIGEVLANAMEHGTCMDESKDIKFSMYVSGKEIVFEVSYEGNLISDENVKNLLKIPEISEVEDLASGGRGIFLIHNIMDKVEYIPKNKSNEVKMRLHKKI